MLKNRVVTAVILAPLIVVAILLLPLDWYRAVWGAVFAVMAWEWSGLSGLEKWPARLGFVAALGGIMATASLWADFVFGWFTWLVVAWWFALSILLRQAPAKLLSWNYPLAAKLLVGAFILVAGWAHLCWLRSNFDEPPLQVLYLLLLIWLADISAYFVGKNWGFTKLAPEVSPGKTVEGIYGALFGAGLFALAVGFYKGFPVLQMVDFAILSIVTVGLSVVGDLFESLVKRIRGVKDSGSVLPGHGGLLDRLDSLLAAAPVFFLGSMELGIFL